MENLPLPWPEADFEAGYITSDPVTLASNRGNGGVYAEVIRILTLWSSVTSCIKTTGARLATKLPAMYALHEKLSSWWQNLPLDMRLASTNVAMVPKKMLPNILLMNVVYHQSLCALHASIVPLFCWGKAAKGDEGWSVARQMSAQVAYEHACIISELLAAVRSISNDHSAMPSFICYGAYSGCAIQIPFLWSSKQSVRERAWINVKTNMNIISNMATFWKYAALLVILLKVYLHCLYNGHKDFPTILNDEPKCVDVMALTCFNMKVPHVQASILDFISILRSNEDGYAKAEEEEPVLEVGSTRAGEGSSAQAPTTETVQAERFGFLAAEKSRWGPPCQLVPSSPESAAQQGQDLGHQEIPQYPADDTNLNQQQPDMLLPTDNTNLNFFQPLLDSEMLGLFPSGELPSMSAFDSSTLGLDIGVVEDWGYDAGFSAWNG
ncbi:hypothetical protein LTR22_013116 [Elasticomyces elasticus]|nr:hypothetical protein LTR22_013116 [Elasticomyces elasticus]KAK4928703.1 hypothetical protein LTR49_004512 [Elasticomyces elasticus]